jgi:hypothetical protein
VTRFGVVVLTALVAFGCGGSSKCADAGKCAGGSGTLGGVGGIATAGASTDGGNASGGNASSGGVGGSSGSGSSGSNTGGVVASAGKGPVPACPPECLVAVTCVTQCGGTPVSVGCCACVDPAFDQRTCP